MSLRARLLRAAGLLALVALVVAAALLVGVPDQQQLRGQVEALGWWAPVAFSALYAAVSLSPLPKTVFTLAAGALFGLVPGLVVVVAGAMLGAVAAFYLGRLLGRDTVRWLTGGRLDRLDPLLTGRRGFRTVLVARLIPIVPFTAVNYVAGLTSVRLRDFIAGTALGILPATTAYVTVGAYGWQPGAWPMWAALATLVLLTVGGLLGERYRRRRAGARADGDPAGGQSVRSVSGGP
ncbi:TVP38/TMEM64 family protein [Dactylosporangium sp. CS-033363]|uniref:TVP38/TMEM64 family protein n=1 Tax=Dactylosporangium sp. CS-033363 TaxID=3239935 RepID=UPI003D8BF3AE